MKTLEEIKTEYITEVYCQFEGNATYAAKSLGISYKTMFYFLKNNPEVKRMFSNDQRRPIREVLKKVNKKDDSWADFSHFNVTPSERDFWYNKDRF